MADDYTSGLNEILGNLTSPTPSVQSPEEDIKNLYEGEMQNQPLGLGGLIESSIQSTTADDVAFDQYAQGVAASDMGDQLYGGVEAERYGPAPQQQITDPHAMIGSTGERVARGLKAGWGDLLTGTGDAVDYVSAWMSPGEADLSTSVGDYLKKVGTEYQKENVLVLSEDLQDITWNDMFNQEFWSSKISRLVPYAASFMIPYTAGSRLAGFGLTKLAPTILKATQGAKVFGTMNKGVKLKGAGGAAFKGTPGKGLLGKLGTDAGKEGIKATKFLRDITGFVGGGGLANLTEGAYLAGEAYQELVNDVDENGEPLFTPEEAASHAAGVVTDNARYMYVDMLQYGILFGGAGRGIMGRLLRSPITKTPARKNVDGIIRGLVRRAAPNLPAIGAYASIEGVTEGFQEVYQEWAKYKNIQEAKGLDYEPMSMWLKEAPFGEDRPELRDIFWSSVGLGGAMGGTRGYFDGVAERQSLIDKKDDAYNNSIDIIKEAAKDQTADQKIAMERAVDNLLASNIWNYGGDGSVAMSIIDNLIKDNKLTEDQGTEYKIQIEQAEINYEKHHINTSLTEAGAEQAFYKEMIKTRQEGYITDELERYEAVVINEKENVKTKSELDLNLEALKIDHNETMQNLNQGLREVEQAIEDIYTRQRENTRIAKSTGKKDARFKKKGLSKDEFETFTQEGEKQKTEAEKAEATKLAAEEAAKPKQTLSEKITSKAIEASVGIELLGRKAVKGVKGLFGKAKDKAQSPETKEAIKKVKDYTKNEITPTAKKYLVKLLEAGKIAATTVATIVGTGLNKIINRGDVDNAVKKEERAEAKETKESQEDVKKKRPKKSSS